MQHGVPGPTWGDRESLPTARRPGRTRQGGGIATTAPVTLTVQMRREDPLDLLWMVQTWLGLD